MHVVVVILEGLFDRFAHGLQAGEMDHGPDRMAGEDPVQERGVTNIALDELRARAAEYLQSIDDAFLTVAEVVENDDVVSSLGKRHAGVRADVAGTAGDQNHEADFNDGDSWDVARGSCFVIGDPRSGRAL